MILLQIGIMDHSADDMAFLFLLLFFLLIIIIGGIRLLITLKKQ